MRVRRRLGELGTPGGEAHAGVEGEAARRDQRGDLPERVARERHRWLGERLHRLPRHQRVEQDRELCVPCAREDVVGGIRDEVGEGLTERGFGAIHDRPRRSSRQTNPIPGSCVPCPGKTIATRTGGTPLQG